MNPLLCQLSYAAIRRGEDTNPTTVDKVGSSHAHPWRWVGFRRVGHKKDSGRLRAETPAEGESVCRGEGSPAGRSGPLDARDPL